MTRTWIELARWVMVLVFAGGTLIGLVGGSTPGKQELFFVTVVVYAAVGWVVSGRQPKNPVGWLFLLVGALTGLAAAADGGMTAALASGDPSIWYGRWGAWLTAWFWFPLFASATLFTMQLFPDGPLSRRWRPLLWVSVATTAVLSIGVSLQTLVPVGDTFDQPKTGCPGTTTLEYGQCGTWVDNPLGAPATLGHSTLGEFGGYAMIGVLIVCFVLAVVSAVIRFRRSSGDARLQMRWFAFAASVLLAWLVVSALFVHDDPLWSEVCFASATALIPLSCGVAILRYRLYDIDRIISRTASYAIVTGLLLATYAVIVISVTRLLPNSSTLAVAGATLTAAALARPLLHRVQHVVDRRFNRARYDAEVTVNAFGQKFRKELHPELVRLELAQAVSSALHPSTVSVWLPGSGP